MECEAELHHKIFVEMCESDENGGLNRMVGEKE
jgi:hypothetical protein